MRQKIIIRQLVAGVLLFVFAFSIAPKKFLHDVIANHKDKAGIASVTGGQQVTNTGFICKCDNLVAESPFTAQDAYTAFSCAPDFASYSEHFSDRIFFSYHSFFELRGPPVKDI